MFLFIDCEFNSLGGPLISLALVSEDGKHEFYEVLELNEPVDPWVQENVMPILNKAPISYESFQAKLKTFLKQFPNVVIKADYPIDIKHMCQCLETGPGDWMMIQPISFIIDDELSGKGSKIPHNALEDARAIQRSWVAKEQSTLD